MDRTIRSHYYLYFCCFLLMTSLRSLLDLSSNQKVFDAYIKPLLSIELLLVLYILLFIFGFTTQDGYLFYNEYRAIQIVLLLFFGLIACFFQRDKITKSEFVFFTLIIGGSVFWAQPAFVISELLLAYLLYKSFSLLQYRQLASKVLVISSLTIFIQFPLALWDYIQTGKYAAIWYPLTWNIRVYDSYFLLVSIFAVWLYLTNQRYRYLYLLFLFLAFLAILLDAGRSAILAYTLFIVTVSMFYRHVRYSLVLVYISSWLVYLSVSYIANLNAIKSSGIDSQILRVTTSLRDDLWINAYQCWSKQPVWGCGFYQLDGYKYLAAHPHNLFIQVLSETGLLGFCILIYIGMNILKHINWQDQNRYFVIAALSAIGIDMFFSGVHIYPVTQMLLLWLFVFLLKNPEFASDGLVSSAPKSLVMTLLPSLFYVLVSVWFIDLLVNTDVFLPEVPFTPPRFWVYGYRL